ncbi:uncharacterized protein [Amphiura filiformis]|uniref:uncharacterized protein n=1 Tax=Amphiura filiformis TaxID=82378 RepID=UPI003B217D4D
MSAYHYLAAIVCVSVLVIDASAQKCCLPDDVFSVRKGGVTATTRTGFLGLLFGQTSLTEEHDSVYDFTNNRFATFITRMIIAPTYVEQHVQVIEQPGKDYVWVIDLDKQKCFKGAKEVYLFHLERCVSDYLIYSNTYYWGNKEIFVDGYYYGMQDPAPGVYSISVTQQCLPISETFIGKTNSWDVSQNVASSMGFYNYTVGIENPDKYFTVPDYCQTEVEQKDNSIFSWW